MFNLNKDKKEDLEEGDVLSPDETGLGEADQQAEELEASQEGAIYTYIGSGDVSPATINYMGLQNFALGHPVKVTNPAVLAKIKNNKCFAQGEVSMDEIISNQEDAKMVVEQKVALNRKIQAAEERENNKHQ